MDANLREHVRRYRSRQTRAICRLLLQTVFAALTVHGIVLLRVPSLFAMLATYYGYPWTGEIVRGLADAAALVISVVDVALHVRDVRLIRETLQELEELRARVFKGHFSDVVLFQLEGRWEERRSPTLAARAFYALPTKDVGKALKEVFRRGVF
jgi:hypothetical protein